MLPRSGFHSPHAPSPAPQQSLEQRPACATALESTTQQQQGQEHMMAIEGADQLSQDIVRDVAELLAHDGLPVQPDSAGESRLAFHRVQGDADVIEIQVVHKFRAHLRQRLPEGEEGSLRLEELSSAATSRSSLLASRRASLSGTPRSGASSASNSVAAGALDAAATAAAAADLLPSSAAQAPSSAGSTGTPSVRDATRRHLLESRQSLQQLGDSRHASAEALQPLVVPRQQQQQQGGLQPPPTLPAAMAPTLAEEQRQEVAAAETREVVGAAAIALFEIRPEDCLVGERLAVGGFAEVFVGRYQGTMVAIKLLLAVDEHGVQRFRQEVQLLGSLRHPNIVLFIGCCTHPYLAIISEFMHRGSLFKLLRKGGNRPLDPKLQRSVAISVARGMAYVHGRQSPLLHLDLKSPNILLDDKWRVKIADFGLSRVRSHTLVSGTGAGTPEWMAPEVLRSEGYDEHCDVWSYGVVLWEVLTGKQPWEGFHAMQVVGAVGFKGASLALPTEGDPFLIDLCRRCLARDPCQRPLFPQIVQELEQHYSSRRSSGPGPLLSHTLSEGNIVLDSSDASLAARAGGARDLPSPPTILAAPPRPSPAVAAPPRALRLPPGLAQRRRGGSNGAASGDAWVEEGSGRHHGGHETDDPFADGAPLADGAPPACDLSPFASGSQPPFGGDEPQPPPQQQQGRPEPPAAGAAQGQLAMQRAPLAGSLPRLLNLHPQASITNELPFAALPPFGDSNDEDDWSGVGGGGEARQYPAAPALGAIPEGSGSLSSAPSRSRSGGVGVGVGSEAALSGRLRLCSLSSNLSSNESSIEDPLQGDYRLPAGALQREPSALLTLRQHLQDAAARAGRPPMARQRSTADLAPAGGTTAGTAGRAPGSGPAPIGLAAVWQSLDDSEL